MQIYTPNKKYGNLYVYFICVLCTVVAIMINYKFSEKLDVESMERKGKIILAD